MRIIYLSRSQFPSSAANSVNVMKMCEAFASLGHEVILIGYVHRDSGYNLFDFYGVKPEFRIEPVPSINASATDFLYVVRSIFEAKTFKPDLAYGRSLEACLGMAMLGVPTIFEMHAPPRSILKKVVLRTLLSTTSLKRVVAISRGLANYLLREFLRSGLPTSKVLVAHDGADPQCVTTNIPAGFESLGKRLEGAFKSSGDKLRVGYIGSLYPGKGMEIISELVHLCPWAVFHIVGGNPKEISLWKKRCSQNGELPSNILFHGFVPHALVGFVCSHLDVALLPTQTVVLNVSGNTDAGWHISPLKLFEYMAAGLPILASDLESVREVLEDGVTGVLIPPHDTLAWRDALAFFRENSEVRKRMGENARKSLVAQFSWKARAEKVLAGCFDNP